MISGVQIHILKFWIKITLCLIEVDQFAAIIIKILSEITGTKVLTTISFVKDQPIILRFVVMTEFIKSIELFKRLVTVTINLKF
jgi:hypothetical protein